MSVYLKIDSAEAALAAARREIDVSGWQWDEFERALRLTREDFEEDAAGIEYFEQALVDGVVLVFHTWNGEEGATSESRH